MYLLEQEQVGIKTPEYVSLQFKLAGLGSRATAFLIDSAILMVANLLMYVIAFVILTGEMVLFDTSSISLFLFGIIIIMMFVIYWGYFIAFEFFSGGRTIGKKLIGIRVIQDNGHSLTLLSSFIRNLLRIIDALPGSYLVGIFMIFFHPQHKRVGDLVAGTIVVHERKAQSKKSLSPVEKEISRRGLAKHDLDLGEWALDSLGAKDWKLIKTYGNRLSGLTAHERSALTKQTADILFGKLGMDMSEKEQVELENALLVLYLHMKDEWEYEL
ncbi:RDD family protein [Siminovitchia sp. FSL H7-0308]|uniref:RDD family protein n=1 Tax=Siminovitchia TaxID=2837510 RepID=UPI002AA53341|nr:RDD family protein [Siminovitchia thermophila]